jgi:dUTP diphosphatase
MSSALTIAIRRLPGLAGLPLPEYKSPHAAAMDLAAAVAEPLVLESGARALVPCGFSIAVPDGYEAQVRPRSGLASRHGVTVVNAPGTIDPDYRGEVMVALINLGSASFVVERGMHRAAAGGAGAAGGVGRGRQTAGDGAGRRRVRAHGRVTGAPRNHTIDDDPSRMIAYGPD